MRASSLTRSSASTSHFDPGLESCDFDRTKNDDAEPSIDHRNYHRRFMIICVCFTPWWVFRIAHSAVSPSPGKPRSKSSNAFFRSRLESASPSTRRWFAAAKANFGELLDSLDQQGFRARIDGELRDLADSIHLARRKNHTIEAVIDRVILKNRGVEKAVGSFSSQIGTDDQRSGTIGVSGGEEQLYFFVHGVPRLRP